MYSRCAVIISFCLFYHVLYYAFLCYVYSETVHNKSVHMLVIPYNNKVLVIILFFFIGIIGFFFLDDRRCILFLYRIFHVRLSFSQKMWSFLFLSSRHDLSPSMVRFECHVSLSIICNF